LRLKDRRGELGSREVLVVSSLGRDDGGIRAEEEVNTRIWHQVGLELVDIDVECSIETKRSCERGDDLSSDSVEVLVAGTLEIEALLANVVKGFVIEKESNVSVLQECVCGENGVVGFNYGGRDVW
jgi:hypothetical protein